MTVATQAFKIVRSQAQESSGLRTPIGRLR